MIIDDDKLIITKIRYVERGIHCSSSLPLFGALASQEAEFTSGMWFSFD